MLTVQLCMSAVYFSPVLCQRMDTDLQALLSSSAFLEDIQIRAILFQVVMPWQAFPFA